MIGKTLSHYRILDELGRGGMGIVYKAEDTKLDRIVAIKVLPAAALSSQDDRARFYREAKAAAQLHHAHIASVFEIDEAIPEGAPSEDLRPFISMEFIEGETLAERIERGPLKLEEAVRIASQVASGLEAAHEKDIVHRDLKSQNIMLTSKGEAKILDFGLAQMAASTKLTRMGSTLGTVAYMSPEQARGEAVDRRTDIWSLGAVLYEMFAGRSPFPGEYDKAVIYGILNQDPEPLTALRTGVPMGLEWLVNKCLAKRAEDRYQSAADLIVDLRNVDVAGSAASRVSTVASASAVAVSPPTKPRTGITTTVLVALTTLVAGVAIGILSTRSSPTPEPFQIVDINLPEMRSVALPTMSPRGTIMAFSGTDRQGRYGLFLRELETRRIRYVGRSGDIGNREILFSPSGDLLAYTRSSSGGVMTVQMPIGVPQLLTDSLRAVFWEDETTLIAVNDRPGGETYRVRLGSDGPELIAFEHGDVPDDYANILKTRIPQSNIAFGHQIPRVGDLLNRDMFLIRVVPEDGQTVEIVGPAIVNPYFVPGGLLLYQQQNDFGPLVVRQVDERTGNLFGRTVAALPEGDSTSWSSFSVTPSGDLVYIREASFLRNQLYLVSLDSLTETALQLRVPGNSLFQDLAYSPDGDRVAVSVYTGTRFNILVYDLKEDRVVRTISSDEQLSRPIWSSDGNWIYYGERSGNTVDAYRTHPTASGESDLVLRDAAVVAVSPNNVHLAVQVGDFASRNLNLMLYDLEVEDLIPIDTSEGRQGRASFSPDGAYLVYEQGSGNPSLRVVSIEGMQQQTIPNISGSFPRWSSDGSRIYFAGNTISEIRVTTNPSFNVIGEAQSLFDSSDVNGLDVSPDHRTAVVAASQVGSDPEINQEVSVVWLQNWSEHLRSEFEK